jgi:radical SAM protein with 4Fe4S-binding SPASM domain
MNEILGQLKLCAQCEEEGKSFVPGSRCSVGFDQVYINSIGHVYPCCFSSERMGDLKQETLSKIWFGPKYSAFRKRLIQGKFAGYCISNRCAIKAVLHQ